MQERLRQEAARTNVQQFAKEQQNCGIKNLWLITSDSQFQRRAIERRIQECLKKQRSQTEERKKRSEVHFYLFELGFLRSFPLLIIPTVFFTTRCPLRICFLHASTDCMPCCRRKKSSSCRRCKGSTEKRRQRDKNG